MKRILFLMIPLLIPGMIAGALLLADLQKRPAWRDNLDQYITYRQSIEPVKIRVISTERAKKPWDFANNPNYTLFVGTSNSKTAAPDDPGYPYNIFNGAAMTSTQAAAYFNRVTSSSSSDGSTGLVSFPPSDLWCILLEITPERGAQERQLLYAAAQQELYFSRWALLQVEGDPSSPTIRQGAAKVGCDLLK